eukprot:CAMPEP_0115846682 /NCGR_PEP_ID=MMETSP0287-20121206/9986_1 /TAXON_ID=412157 /ORGANISM="Chrysochromulina rotalis, Strain UIO044" /LENGTH=177 /DNA_ID=CAMNT_0003300479 /DNA_START=484 /DNA_END=1013 /DNA_ORIENTATION=+
MAARPDHCNRQVNVFDSWALPPAPAKTNLRWDRGLGAEGSRARGSSGGSCSRHRRPCRRRPHVAPSSSEAIVARCHHATPTVPPGPSTAAAPRWLHHAARCRGRLLHVVAHAPSAHCVVAHAEPAPLEANVATDDDTAADATGILVDRVRHDRCCHRELDRGRVDNAHDVAGARGLE